MASAIRIVSDTWRAGAPYIYMTVTPTNVPNSKTTTLSWELYYHADSPIYSSNAKNWSLSVGQEKHSGSFSIRSKTGDNLINSGSTVVTRQSSVRTFACSIKMDIEATWSGVYKSSISGSRNVSIDALPLYSLSYNANGGSSAPSSQSGYYLDNITLSSTTPTRTGYSFSGWATSSSGSVAYQPGGVYYSISSNVTLYAKWNPNRYTVSYNANGGSGAPFQQTKIYGINMILSSTRPTRANYTFQGWATSSSGSVVYQPGDTYTNNSSVTLYAKWSINYTPPRITGLKATRCNQSGTASEDGTYFKLEFSWAIDSGQTVSSCNVSWEGSDGSSRSSSISLSGTSGSVSRIFGSGSVSSDYSYTITVKLVDSGGNTSQSVILPSKLFIIDVRYDGSGIALGKPSESAGLECDYTAKFNKSVTLIKPLPVSSGGTGANNASSALNNLGAAASDHTHSYGGIELTPSAGAGHGGFIDFHFNGSTADYTSRIIENSSGVLYTPNTWEFNTLLNTGGKYLLAYFTVSGSPHVQLGHKEAYMYLNCKKGRMDVTDTNGTFGFYWQNGTSGSIWASHSDGKGALGNPGMRWNTVYATTGSIQTSDRRKKKDISENLDAYLRMMSRLTPIRFRYNDLEEDKIRFGFIAQDVEEAAEAEGINVDDVTFLRKEHVEDEQIPDGILYELVYSEFIPLNTAMIQKQQQQINELEERLNKIENLLDTKGE